MAVLQYTVVGEVRRPGLNGELLDGVVTISSTAGTMRDSLGSTVFTGTRRIPVVNGLVQFSLPATNDAEIQPKPFQWVGAFKSRDGEVVIPLRFDLTANRTFGEILELTGAPVTNPLKAQVLALVAQAQAAAESAASDATLISEYSAAQVMVIDHGDGTFTVTTGTDSAFTVTDHNDGTFDIELDGETVRIGQPVAGDRGIASFRRKATSKLAVFGGDQSPAWQTNAPSGGSISTSVTDADFVTAGRVITSGTGGSGGVGSVGRFYLDYTSAIKDFNNTGFRVSVKISDVTHLHSIHLGVTDDFYSGGYIDVAIYSPGSLVGVVNNQVAYLDFYLQKGVAVGTTTTLSSINSLRLEVYDDNSGNPVTVHVGKVETFDATPVFPRGVVSLCFDDTTADHYTSALPQLSRRGMVGTLFPVVGVLDTAGALTTAQVESMVHTHGWECGAHATTATAHALGLPSMTTVQRKTELQALRTWLADHRFTTEAYAYPLGAWSSAAIDDLRPYFKMGRKNTLGDGTQRQTPRPYEIDSADFYSQTLGALTALVDQAVSSGGWLCITFHDVTTGALATKFTGLLDYIATVGIPVRTMTEVLRANATVEQVPAIMDALPINVQSYRAPAVASDSAAVFAAVTDAAVTSRSVYFPAGTYNLTTRVNLPDGVTVFGEGDTSRITGTGFTTNSNNHVTRLKFIAAGQTGVISSSSGTPVDTVIDDCTFDGCSVGVYLEATATNYGAARYRVSGNRFYNCTAAAVFAPRFYDCRITDNISKGAINGNFLFFGGQRNVITGNTTYDGITGIAFIYQRTTANYAGVIVGNVVANNRVHSPSEEGISFDVRGSVAADIGTFDYATVTSAANSGSTLQVTLSESAYSTSGGAFFGYYMAFMTGTLAGQAFQITGHSNSVLSSGPTIAGAATDIVAGDKLVIGAPAVGNIIQSNTISDAGTNGIVLWGNAFGNTIANNTLTGPRTTYTTGTSYPTAVYAGGIELASLNGLATSTVNVTGTQGKAPVMGNLVSGNVVQYANIRCGLMNYGGTGYTSLKNRVVNNTVIGGVIVADQHTVTWGGNTAVTTGSTSGALA